MKPMLSLAIAVTLFAAHPTFAQEPPPTKPHQEHEWLKKFVGNWRIEGQVQVPGEESVPMKGSQKARMVGGIWVVIDGEATCMGWEAKSVLTLGYEPTQKRFTGTWIDSAHPYLWTYKGELDKEANKLTLHTRGPNPMEGGKMMDFVETFQWKSDDTYHFRSAMKKQDGSTVDFMTATYTRID